LKGNEDPRLLGFHDLLKLGEDYGKANPGFFEQNIDTGRGEGYGLYLLYPQR